MKPRLTTVARAATGISPGRPSRCRPLGRVRFITMLTALLDSAVDRGRWASRPVRHVTQGRDLLRLTLRVTLVLFG